MSLALLLWLVTFFGLALMVRSSRGDTAVATLSHHQTLETRHRAAAIHRVITMREGQIETLAREPFLTAALRERKAGSLLMQEAQSRLELMLKLMPPLEALCVLDSGRRPQLQVLKPERDACPTADAELDVEAPPGGGVWIRVVRPVPGTEDAVVSALFRLQSVEDSLAPLALAENVFERFRLRSSAFPSVAAGEVLVTSQVGERRLWVDSTFDRAQAAALFRASPGLFAVGVAGFSLSGLVGLLIVLRGLMKSLRQVVDVTQQMAAGELSVRMPVTGGREVRRLARSVNHLASCVQRSYSDVERLRREFIAEMEERKTEAHAALELTWAVQREAQEAAARAGRDAELLAAKNVKLERSLELKSELLGNMSHELRTPLNAVLGFSELLLEGVHGSLNPEQREAARDINTAGRHLLGIINDLLDLSRAESGQMTFARVLMDFRDPVRESLEMARPLAAKKNITLHLQLDTPVAAVGDGRRLRQVALNLLSNAVKFTPERGDVWVTVRASKDGASAELEVKDSGMGIDPLHHALIFEAFGQVDDQRLIEGTGLGLALVRRFTQGMGGTVRVDSQLGHGACFTVCLPAGEIAPADDAPVPLMTPDSIRPLPLEPRS